MKKAQKTFRRIVPFIFTISLLLGIAMSANAEVSEHSDSSILSSVLVQDGKAEFLTKEETEQYIAEETRKAEEIANMKEQSQNNLSVPRTSIQPNGAFGYRYVYRQTGFVAGLLRLTQTRRISSEYRNSTSVNQSVQLSWSVTQNFSITAGISGEWLEAVKASLGASWTGSCSASSVYTITIAPGKTVWLEFAPRMDNSWGYVDKYFTNPGGRILEESKWVDTYKTSYIYNSAMKKNVPDGLYTFRER